MPEVGGYELRCVACGFEWSTGAKGHCPKCGSDYEVVA